MSSEVRFEAWNTWAQVEYGAPRQFYVHLGHNAGLLNGKQRPHNVKPVPAGTPALQGWPVPTPGFVGTDTGSFSTIPAAGRTQLSMQYYEVVLGLRWEFDHPAPQDRRTVDGVDKSDLVADFQRGAEC